MVILITILVLYCGVSSYIVWNLLKKVEMQELALESMYEQVSTTLRVMKELDNRQMFENDDEVGTVYAQVSNTVNSLKIILGEKTDGFEETA